MTWWVVYKKELRETLRDRRTLAVMILLPLVLYPIMSVVTAEVLIAHEATRQARPSHVILGGPGATAPAVQAALGDADTHVDLTVAPEIAVEARQGVRALGGADAVVIVPADPARTLRELGTLDVKVYFDASSDDSMLARDRVEQALGAWSDKELAARLGEENLSAAFAHPVSLTVTSVASTSRLGRSEAAKTLPIMIVLMVLMGAFYPAIDLTAGEKERGTLEPLLATPAPRRAIMTGKLATVATISALTGLLNLLCLAGAGLWVVHAALRAKQQSMHLGQVAAAIPWGALALSIGVLMVATLLFAGITMAVASLARGFKEAQNFLTPVTLVATMPAMVALLPGAALSYGSALVPVANVTLLLKGAIAGDLRVGPAALALAASAAWAAAALALAVRVYDSERLLFAPEAAPGEARSLLARLRAPRAAVTPDRSIVGAALEPGEALALFAIAAVLLLGPGGELQMLGLGGVAASLWLCLALPVVVAARVRTGRIAAPLGLARPSARQVVGATLVGLSGWIVLATLVLPLQEHLFPTPPAIREALEGLVAPDEPMWLTLCAVAITPAICEELLCRGALARSLHRSLGRTGAVIVSALLFALLHMSAYRFVPTFLLGCGLAVVALATGSTFTSMIVHGLNNAAVVLLSSPIGARLARLLDSTPLAAAASVPMLVLGFALVLRPSGTQK